MSVRHCIRQDELIILFHSLVQPKKTLIALVLIVLVVVSVVVSLNNECHINMHHFTHSP